MLKTVVYCDFCEKPIPEDKDDIVRICKPKEFDTRKQFPHMCETCAARIDNVLREYKLELAHQAGLASKFAQINEERKKELETEG